MSHPMIPIVPLVRLGTHPGWRGAHRRSTLRLLSAFLVALLLLSVIGFIGPA